MMYVSFILGIIFGTVLTRLIFDFKSLNGWYSVRRDESSPDPTDYLINVKLPNGVDISKKTMIVLHKEKSHK